MWQLSCLHRCSSKNEGERVPMVHKGSDKVASEYKIVQNATNYRLIDATYLDHQARRPHQTSIPQMSKRSLNPYPALSMCIIV